MIAMSRLRLMVSGWVSVCVVVSSANDGVAVLSVVSSGALNDAKIMAWCWFTWLVRIYNGNVRTMLKCTIVVVMF